MLTRRSALPCTLRSPIPELYSHKAPSSPRFGWLVDLWELDLVGLRCASWPSANQIANIVTFHSHTRLALTTAISDLAFSHPRFRPGCLPLSTTLSSGRGNLLATGCFLCSHQSYPSLNNTSNRPALLFLPKQNFHSHPSCRPQLFHQLLSLTTHANYTACTTTSFSYAGAAAKTSIPHSRLRSSQVMHQAPAPSPCQPLYNSDSRSLAHILLHIPQCPRMDQ